MRSLYLLDILDLDVKIGFKMYRSLPNQENAINNATAGDEA